MGRQELKRLLLAPFFAWILFFIMGPLCLLLILSFSHRSGLGEVESIFDPSSYASLVQPVYWKVFSNTLFFAGANTLLTLLVAFPMAWLMVRSTPQYKTLLMALILIPFWTSYLVRIFAFMGVLRTLSFEGATLLYTPLGVLLGLIYNYLPFAVLPIFASLERIETKTLEAAQDLGATKCQVLFNVILPMCRGGLISAGIFVFVPSLGEFLIPELVGGGRDYLLGSFLQNQFMSARNWPLGSAAIVILVGITLMTVLGLPNDEKSFTGKGV